MSYQFQKETRSTPKRGPNRVPDYCRTKPPPTLSGCVPAEPLTSGSEFIPRRAAKIVNIFRNLEIGHLPPTVRSDAQWGEWGVFPK